jgi:hypothetical protein
MAQSKDQMRIGRVHFLKISAAGNGGAAFNRQCALCFWMDTSLFDRCVSRGDGGAVRSASLEACLDSSALRTARLLRRCRATTP